MLGFGLETGVPLTDTLSHSMVPSIKGMELHGIAWNGMRLR